MKTILVCLHGWGGSKESFTELRQALKNDAIEILTPDLPGFGGEPEPNRPWTVDDYADWVTRWIDKQGTSGKRETGSNLHLLGHSHGGRIALRLAQRQSTQSSQLMSQSFLIEHLFLCAAAGIKHPRHVKRIIGLTLAKSGAFFLKLPLLKQLAPLGKKILYKLVRVHDYEEASPVMRQTLIHVSREDLRPILKDIDIPTDIFWGKDDGMTPFSDALILRRELRGSVLHAYDHVRHAVHRDKAEEIATVIRSRIQPS